MARVSALKEDQLQWDRMWEHALGDDIEEDRKVGGSPQHLQKLNQSQQGGDDRDRRRVTHRSASRSPAQPKQLSVSTKMQNAPHHERKTSALTARYSSPSRLVDNEPLRESSAPSSIRNQSQHRFGSRESSSLNSPRRPNKSTQIDYGDQQQQPQTLSQQDQDLRDRWLRMGMETGKRNGPSAFSPHSSSPMQRSPSQQRSPSNSEQRKLSPRQQNNSVRHVSPCQRRRSDLPFVEQSHTRFPSKHGLPTPQSPPTRTAKRKAGFWKPNEGSQSSIQQQDTSETENSPGECKACSGPNSDTFFSETSPGETTCSDRLVGDEDEDEEETIDSDETEEPVFLSACSDEQLRKLNSKRRPDRSQAHVATGRTRTNGDPVADGFQSPTGVPCTFLPTEGPCLTNGGTAHQSSHSPIYEKSTYRIARRGGNKNNDGKAKQAEDAAESPEYSFTRKPSRGMKLLNTIARGIDDFLDPDFSGPHYHYPKTRGEDDIKGVLRRSILEPNKTLSPIAEESNLESGSLSFDENDKAHKDQSVSYEESDSSELFGGDLIDDEPSQQKQEGEQPLFLGSYYFFRRSNKHLQSDSAGGVSIGSENEGLLIGANLTQHHTPEHAPKQHQHVVFGSGDGTSAFVAPTTRSATTVSNNHGVGGFGSVAQSTPEVGTDTTTTSDAETTVDAADSDESPRRRDKDEDFEDGDFLTLVGRHSIKSSSPSLSGKLYSSGTTSDTKSRLERESRSSPSLGPNRRSEGASGGMSVVDSSDAKPSFTLQLDTKTDAVMAMENANGRAPDRVSRPRQQDSPISQQKHAFANTLRDRPSREKTRLRRLICFGGSKKQQQHVVSQTSDSSEARGSPVYKSVSAPVIGQESPKGKGLIMEDDDSDDDEHGGHAPKMSLLPKLRMASEKIAEISAEQHVGPHMSVVYDSFGTKPEEQIKLVLHGAPPEKVQEGLIEYNKVVLIVEASTVSHTDCAIRNGKWSNEFNVSPPITPGVDVVGRVLRIDTESSRLYGLKAGDRVTSLVRWGGNARYLTVDPSKLVKIQNEKVDPAHAVCLVETYLHAFQLLHSGQHKSQRYRARSLHDKTIFVSGEMTSNLGRAIANLCSLGGCRKLFAAVKPKHFATVSAMGVTPVELSDPHKWTERLRGSVDLVVHLTGRLSPSVASKILRPHVGNIVVATVFSKADSYSPSPTTSPSPTASSRGSSVESRVTRYSIFRAWEDDREWIREDLRHLLVLLDKKKLEPMVLDRIPLSKVGLAHRLLETKRHAGFIVCEPWLEP